MALQLYALISVYVNGALLAEEATVRVRRDTRAQEVNTVAKGFAGLSPGAQKTMITVENAVPAAGLEFDPSQFLKSLSVVELTLARPDGKTLTSKGFITSDDMSHSVNTESRLSFEFEGEPAVWQ